VIGSSLPPGSPHKEVIGEVLSEIDRLDATARDLLIYARPKPPLRKKLRVGQLLQDTLMQLRQEPAVQGLRIHGDGLECAADALVDDTQFRQVISNLLLNAAHACEKGGEVTFRVSSEEGMVRIEVGDTGIGIPAEAVPHTFEPFYTTKAKGTGLGLPICRWIVESHGGRIRLESERGQGTTVTIELPHQP
jgi:signal transduction histidine kinase